MDDKQAVLKKPTPEQQEYYRQRIIAKIQSMNKAVLPTIKEIRDWVMYSGMTDERINTRLNALDMDLLNLLDLFERLKFIKDTNDTENTDNTKSTNAGV